MVLLVVPRLSSFLLHVLIIAQCSSAQMLSDVSTSHQPRNLISTRIASLSGGISASAVSEARNATTKTSVSSSLFSSTTTDDVTAIAGPPASSARTNATAATTASAPPRPSNTQPCNGYTEFCQRKYSNLSMVVAHNSPFVKEHNAASNQVLPVLTQLNDGIRGCKSRVHANGEFSANRLQ
jgi:hypothetical protein